MSGDPVVLGHWWNGLWGTRTRRDVWVEHRGDDPRFYVRWRGGQWRDRDGLMWTTDKGRAWAAIRLLMDDGGTWRRIDSGVPATPWTGTPED